jgi:hypothetical protein
MASKAQIQAQEQLLELLSSKNQIVKKSSELLYDQLDVQNKISAKQKDQVKTLTLISKTEKTNLDINDKLNILKNRAKQVTDKTLNVEIKKLKVQKAGTDAVQAQADALMNGLNKATSYLKKIPGGSLFVTAMGLGPKNLSKLQSNLAEVVSGGRKFKDVTKELPKNFGKTIVVLGVLGAAVGVVLGTIKLIGKALKFASTQIDRAGEAFGVMGARGGQFTDNLLRANVAAIGIGKNMGDVINVTDTLTKNFGIGANQAARISAKVLDTSVALGISSNEAADLFGSFIVIGGLSLEQAENLAESTYQLAQQNKVNPSAVMKDMAANAELIAKFGAQNLESITKAAVKSRQLGLNLSDIATASEGFLDFQGSLTKEFEAEILLGRDLELSRARQFSLAGDLDGVMGEIVKNVGSENALLKMNVIQRRALAAAVGLNERALVQMVRQQDKSVTQSKSFVDLMGKDGMSAITSIINRVKQLGADLLTRFGTSSALTTAINHIEDFLRNPELGATITKMFDGLEQKFNTLIHFLAKDIPFYLDAIKTQMESIAGFVNNLPSAEEIAKGTGRAAVGGGAAIGGGVAGYKVTKKATQKGLTKLAGKTAQRGLARLLIGGVSRGAGFFGGGPLGAVVAGAAADALFNFFVDDFQSGGGSHLIVTPSGQMLRTNPKDTIMGSTKVNDFVSGPAGSMPLGSDNKETNQKLDKLNANIESLIRVTQASPNRLGSVIEGFR